ARLKEFALSTVVGQPFSTYQVCTVARPEADPESTERDDLKREASFRAQAKAATMVAIQILHKEGAPVFRPSDYFAEMVKTDEHMSKLKKKLLAEAEALKASEQARKQRENKKFGKKVQHATMMDRLEQKKDSLEKIKLARRKVASQANTKGDFDAVDGADDQFAVELDDAPAKKTGTPFDRKSKPAVGASKRGGAGGGRMPRSARDDKYGFGGKKRFSKS
ncbi:eukaryotic rRNA processing, partial [Caulochytrium protostelioides]